MLVSFAVLLAACGPAESGTGSADATTQAIEVEDAAGRMVQLERPAERIVCLDGSCIDALSELGLVPEAVSNLNMASHPDYFGPDAAIGQIAGSFFEPDIEEIIMLEPDLVLGTLGVHSDLVAAIEPVAPVYLQSIPSLDEARAYVRTIGELTDRRTEADEAVEAFDARLAAYADAVDGARVPLSMYGSDLDFGIDAANSIIGQLLAEVTAYPWPESDDVTGFLDFSVERILEVDPDAIFVQTFAFDPDTRPLSEQLQENPLWSELAAVQAGEVYEVDTAYWASGRGTRTMTLILDVVIPTLYPESVPEPLG
jgi:iron complex transport system substrate-binding protein